MTASDVVAATSESDLRPDRPDAFISYSRRDGGFVSDRLVPALVNAGQDIWLDLDDIPAGTDWEARIADGLDAAKAVICVLSPDYAASAICEYEVTRASERQKLLIPVLRRDVAPTALPAPLRALNWVLLRDEDPFEPQIARLLEALADDLPWRDMHARLAVRAREWEASSDNSYLLRGKDLDAAEEWLRDQERHQARPTGSQTSYIVASRQASTRRRSVTLGAVGVALLITAALAVVALISRGQAVHRAQDRSVARARRCRRVGAEHGSGGERPARADRGRDRAHAAGRGRSAPRPRLEPRPREPAGREPSVGDRRQRRRKAHADRGRRPRGADLGSAGARAAGDHPCPRRAGADSLAPGAADRGVVRPEW